MSKRRAAKGLFWAQDPVVATQRQTKLKFAYAINRIFKNRKLLRVASAGMLGLAPQKVANLRSYNLKNFSVEELVGFLASLNRSQDNGVLRR